MVFNRMEFALRMAYVRARTLVFAVARKNHKAPLLPARTEASLISRLMPCDRSDSAEYMRRKGADSRAVQCKRSRLKRSDIF